MSTLLAITLAAAATVQPSCSWDNPGVNPYTGNSAAAIDRYTDIPETTRVKLKRRVEYGNPDETVSITRDAITGRHHYDTRIRDMHFGKASVCGTVTRGKWSETRAEPAAVYCADKHCILVPKICGNISRVTRIPALAAAQPRPAGAPPRAWDIADPGLGLVDAPEFDVTTLPEMELVAFAPVARRPLAAAPVNDAPKGDGYTTPPRQPFPVLPGNPGGGGPPGKPVFPGSPVAPVPEPETYAMLLAGLGLLGYMARRKQRRAAAERA